MQDCAPRGTLNEHTTSSRTPATTTTHTGLEAHVTAPDMIDTPGGQRPARQVARHECGHAAASLALGYQFDRISMTGPLGPAMYHVEVGTPMKNGHRWVINACGAIADWQSRGLKIRDSQIIQLVLGGEGDTFELDDATTGQVKARVFRSHAVQPGGDLHSLATVFASGPRQEAVPELIRFWREFERFARELRPAIDALTEALLERGQLTYREAWGIVILAMITSPSPMPVLAEWLR
jgi:hypothetical protein